MKKNDTLKPAALQPSKKTIAFILAYSRNFNTVQTKDIRFTVSKN